MVELVHILTMLLGKDKPTVFLRALAGMSVVLFGFMLLHTSETASVLGRYSLRYTFYLLEVLALAICFALLSVRAYRERVFRKAKGHLTPRVANWIVYGALLSIPLLYGFYRFLVVPDRRPAFENNLLVLLAVVPLLAAWYLHRYGRLWEKLPGISLLAVSLLLVILHLFIIAEFLGDIPNFSYWDEPWEASISLGSVRDFGPADRIIISDHTNKNRITRYFWQFINGLVQRIAGVGWLQARLFYLVMGIIACPFIFLTARRLYCPVAAWAAALLAFYLPLHHNVGRPDIWVPTATAIATHFYFMARDERAKYQKWASFACGFFIVSTVDGHLYGFCFAFTLCGFHLFEQLASIRRDGPRLTARFGYFVAGCALYCLFWLWYHFALPGLPLVNLPKIIAADHNAQQTIDWVEGDLQRIFKMFRSILSRNFNHKHLELLLGLVVGTLALFRGKKSDRFLLIWFGSSLLLLFYIMAHPNRYYDQYAIPFLALWFGGALQDACRINGGGGEGLSRLGPGLSRCALLSLVTTMLILAIGVHSAASGPVNLAQRLEFERMIAIGREFDEYLPEEDIPILGNFPMFLGMTWRDNYRVNLISYPDPDSGPIIEPLLGFIHYPRYYQSYYYDIAGIWRYIRENSFRPVVCIPLPDINDDLWERVGGGQPDISILYLAPEYTPRKDEHPCTPELFAEFPVP